MKTTGTRILLAAWVLSATAALAHFWLARPDLGPQVPAALSLWLVELYGSTNGEELRDLETVLALASSFLVILFLTFLGWRILRRHERRTVS